MSDGNRHDHHDLPTLLVGGASTAEGRASPHYKKDTPITNLFLIARQTRRFADSWATRMAGWTGCLMPEVAARGRSPAAGGCGSVRAARTVL